MRRVSEGGDGGAREPKEAKPRDAGPSSFVTHVGAGPFGTRGEPSRGARLATPVSTLALIVVLLLASAPLLSCGPGEVCWCPPGAEDCPAECEPFDCSLCPCDCPECEEGNGENGENGGNGQNGQNGDDPCEEDPEHEDCVEDCDPPECGDLECGVVYNDCDEWIECGECAGDYVCEEGYCILPACPATDVVQGQATYYAANGTGNCSYPHGTGMPFVVALSNSDYAAAAYCGACIEVEGPDGWVVVKSVDRCPGCSAGHLDLSREAFQEISPLSAGLVPITWRIVPCDYDEPVAFFWESDSDQWWSSVQVRRHRNAITELEVRSSDGDFVTVARQSHNMYFMSGRGAGPFDFRLTDIHGNVLVEEGIPLSPGGVVQGSGQFPDCEP